MMTAWLQGPMFRLNIVVMSSLAFLVYGFSPPSGVVEVLQLPVAAMQVYFILAVFLQVGVRGFVAPLTRLQRGLIATLIVYMIIVSTISPVPSAHILVISWVIHLLFFVALISFFQRVDLDRAEVIWSVLGLTALLHVAAFLLAWLVWPEEIKPKTLLAFGHIRHLGYLLAPAAAVMAVQFVTLKERAFLPLLCFAAAALYLFFTGSRGGAIALLGGFVIATFYLVWNRYSVQASRVIALVFIVGALIAAAEILPPLPWGTILDRSENALNQTGFEMLTGRDQVWRLIVAAIGQNWSWGYGPSLMVEVPGYQGQVLYHPHNIILQLLLHWGVVGTTLLLATVATFGRNIWEALRTQPGLSVLPSTVLATMGIHSLIDGNFFYPFSTTIAIIAVAMLDAIGRRQSDSFDLQQENTPLRT